MLSGLISRWPTPRECMCAIAEAFSPMRPLSIERDHLRQYRLNCARRKRIIGLLHQPRQSGDWFFKEVHELVVAKRRLLLVQKANDIRVLQSSQRSDLWNQNSAHRDAFQ